MPIPSNIVDRVRRSVNRERLLETATQLLAVPSPTGQAGHAADCLADILARDGFTVKRVEGGHPAAPAVVARFDSKRPGKTLQFNGHLDTVHLPYVAPAVTGDLLTGSGASDMKAGTAAAVEALRVLRDTDVLEAGSILFTAHDLHEAPWGFGQQLDRLIADGVVGDAVLIPEPLCDCLPVVGRGSAVWKAVVRRAGPPVHEVMRPADEPSVILAGSKLVARLDRLNRTLSAHVDPRAGSESVFIGQIHSGEIFNQYPQVCCLEGTRRWLPGMNRAEVEKNLRELFEQEARESGVEIQADICFIRDAFRLDPEDRVVRAFQQAYRALRDEELPAAAKPFVDDGNSFWGLAQRPAITHGPRAGGQHTVNEWVSIDDLVRVAAQYVLTAVTYCPVADDRVTR